MTRIADAFISEMQDAADHWQTDVEELPPEHFDGYGYSGRDFPVSGDALARVKFAIAETEAE
jgi:hypothetical protein